MNDRTLGGRIYLARVGNGKCSRSEFGRRVAEMEGRPSPYRGQTVADWENGVEPSLATLHAMAKVAGVRVEWLVFRSGVLSAAA